MDLLSDLGDVLRNADKDLLPECDDDFISHLDAEFLLVKTEVDQCRARAKQLKEELEELWATERTAEYELSSVFIHRGTSPSWGHYFFYSRHLPGSPDTYFKYNDSEVSLVTKEEVLADGTTDPTANPYLVSGDCQPLCAALERFLLMPSPNSFG